MTLFSASSLGSLLKGRHMLEKLIRAIYEIGVRCIPITLIVGLFTGLVLGLQLYYVLTKFSSESLLGQAVALSIIMEIGPVFTAIMIVGQAGSALSAEWDSAECGGSTPRKPCRSIRQFLVSEGSMPL